MKKYLITIISVVMMMCFSTSIYAITLEDLQQQFSKHKIIHADFIQERYINGLSAPLHSSGKMIISQDLGLWWQQLTPFIMTLKMNQQRMEQSVDGQQPQIITAENQPQLFQFNHLLTAIFTADKQLLENNFEIILSEQNHQWTLILTPKIAPLNKIFKQITLHGNTYLQTIAIDDKQDDKTIITFKNHKTTKLTQHEQLLFK